MFFQDGISRVWLRGPAVVLASIMNILSISGRSWVCQNRVCMPEQGWKTVRVPASSANLGPGFDALGMALDLHLECRFRAASELEIRVRGRDAAVISTGDDNLIWRTALQVAADVSAGMPPIELEIGND